MLLSLYFELLLLGDRAAAAALRVLLRHHAALEPDERLAQVRDHTAVPVPGGGKAIVQVFSRSLSERRKERMRTERNREEEMG